MHIITTNRLGLHFIDIKSINLPFLNMVTAMSSTYNKH